MEYLIVFIEGIITFISPCLLPMLPVYISYFAGQNATAVEYRCRMRTVRNALGFVLGFTIVFVLLGAFAGSIGRALIRYSTAVNVVSGAVMILFGLHFAGVIRIPFLEQSRGMRARDNRGFWSTVVFGIVFSISWTPCVGAFLGSALMMAASSGQTHTGILMLLLYSLGLGIPFMICAVVLENLGTAFHFIKRHYRKINLISGGLLIVVGILMIFGAFGAFLSALSM